MNSRLDKTAVITGGGSGIGAAAAHQFAGAGFEVFILDRSAENAAAVADEIQSGGGRALSAEVDVTELDAISRALENWGLTAIDVLVNSAGIREIVEFEDLDSATWQGVIDVNLTGTFNSCKAAHRLLRRPGAAVVNVSSIAGQIGVPGRIAYTASKHGVVGLTRALASDLGRDGIRVNAVCPGVTETSLTKAYFEDSSIAAAVRRATPLRRWADASEIAAVILFLGSDAASFVTGSTLNVDGGYAAVKSFDSVSSGSR